MIKRGNLFSPAAKSDEEFLEVLMSCKSGGARVERIVSQGHASPPDFWYDQNEQEFVAVLKGNAELEFEDGTVMNMSLGDWVIIPEHCRHRVNSTSEITPCVWLAVFGKN
ncbi:MAG: cupin domain-containing protein [Synergistaceae bacterium]|nr:cupin domain-containing protein [Synergistaceae bacterium]